MTQLKRTSSNPVGAPFSILAELTHRCPLHCPYCSNPLELTLEKEELKTEDWRRVLTEAAEMGVVEVHFSGGEPLIRDDLETLIRHANDLEMYTNLITSGIGLSEEKVNQLKLAGLANVQISFQAAEAKLSDVIGGYKAFEKKHEAVKAVKKAELHLSLNVVLHRMNIDQLQEIIQLAENLGAERLELANAQYYNWALLNRDQLLPSRVQVERANSIYMAAKERLRKEMEIIWVIPDYYASSPKPCMGGWGTIGFTVAPNGDVLPCPTAGIIEGLTFENVRKSSLKQIWYVSKSFNNFRGEEWMPEPCSSCDFRHEDGGGCRCQAFALTGNASAADPVCEWSTDHHLIESAVQDINKNPDNEIITTMIYRKYHLDKVKN